MRSLRASVPIINCIHSRGASTLKSYVSWCSCRREVGVTDGAVLIIGGMEIRRPVTLWCACGVATYWRPVQPREDSTPVPAFRPVCYTEGVEV
jgi:hypothetical protein